MLDGELTLQIAGRIYSGWESVRVTRGAEHLPNTFEIGGTPPAGFARAIAEGSAAKIYIDGDLAITGYADTIDVGKDPDSHDLTISGRGKCQDLVDCTSEWPGSIINQADVGDVATKLCSPYGIGVQVLADILSNDHPDVQALKIPTFSVDLTETPAAIIAEMARYFGVLAYEAPSGDLVLARAGSRRAASGFQAGANLKSWRYRRSTADRFSLIKVYSQSTQALDQEVTDPALLSSQADPNVARHRVRAITSAAPTLGPAFAQREALWEVAYRAGRSRHLLGAVAGWRDQAGELWEPNTLAPVQIPSEGVAADWILSHVTYVRDAQGTRTEVALMPPDAFSIEPINLVPAAADVLEGLTGDEDELTKG